MELITEGLWVKMVKVLKQTMLCKHQGKACKKYAQMCRGYLLMLCWMLIHLYVAFLVPST